MVWIQRVGPPGEGVAGERPEIEVGIFAAQGEFEAGFAVLVAMAGAGVAAAFGEHRHDLVAEGGDPGVRLRSDRRPHAGRCQKQRGGPLNQGAAESNAGQRHQRV